MSKPKFNSDQRAAYEKLIHFISKQNKEKLFLLNGPAGSGKTFLIANTLGSMDNKVIMTAPTNKALTVLRNANPLQKARYKTIHSLLGFQRNIDDMGKIDFDTDNEVFDSVLSTTLNGRSIVVIDEASMITKKIFYLIEQMVSSEPNVKVIYIGDSFQLPPVNETTSKVFKSNYMSYTLSKIERAKKQDIIDYGTAIRNGIKPPKFKDGSVSYYKNSDLWIKNYISDYENSIILAYTNKRVNWFNKHIRSLLFKELRRFNINEKIIFTNFYSTGTVSYYSSQIEYVRKIDIETLVLSPLKIEILRNLKLKHKDKKCYQLKNTPSLKEPCPICYEDEVSTLAETPCGHLFCEECINLWTSKNDHCPMCRMKLVNDEVNINDDPVLSKYINAFIKITSNFKVKIYLLNDHIRVLHDDSKDYYNNNIKRLSALINQLRTHIYKTCKSSDKDFNKSMLAILWCFYHDNYIDSLSQIDYGYALTIHKSQGSTYENVYFDLQNTMYNKTDLKQCVYTAITRASHSLKVLR